MEKSKRVFGISILCNSLHCTAFVIVFVLLHFYFILYTLDSVFYSYLLFLLLLHFPLVLLHLCSCVKFEVPLWGIIESKYPTM